LRVTDKESVEIVDEVLSKEITPGITKEIISKGGKARAFSGRDVFKVVKSPTFEFKGETVDLGFVGDVVGCQFLRVLEAVREEVVPVISPVGEDEQGQAYNVNADIAAAEIAISLEAAKLIYLSDVNGVLRDPKDPETLIPTITPKDIEALKKEGIIDGGMLPKMNSCVKALKQGVNKIHLIDGRIPHGLLLELFTDRGIGTEIVKD